MNNPETADANVKASRSGQLKKHFRSRWFWGSIVIIMAFFIVMISLQLNMQWFWLLLYAVITVPFAPFIRSPVKFFRYVSSVGSLFYVCIASR